MYTKFDYDAGDFEAFDEPLQEIRYYLTKLYKQVGGHVYHDSINQQ